jgi:hypothetical protein
LDPPFGIGIATWDGKDMVMNGAKLEILLRQVQAVNSADDVFIVCYYNLTYHAEFMTVLKSCGFEALTNLFLYKAGQNYVGKDNYVHATDTVIIGQAPKRSKGCWDLDKNPLLRHNTICVPNLTVKQQHADGTPVNVHEKHPAVAKGLLEAHSLPGSTVLIPFAGAGSEVIGAIMAGRNVIALENDPVQFRALCSRVTQFAEMPTMPPICPIAQPGYFINKDTYNIRTFDYPVPEPEAEEVPAAAAVAAPPAMQLLDSPMKDIAQPRVPQPPLASEEPEADQVGSIEEVADAVSEPAT